MQHGTRSASAPHADDWVEVKAADQSKRLSLLNESPPGNVFSTHAREMLQVSLPQCAEEKP